MKTMRGHRSLHATYLWRNRHHRAGVDRCDCGSDAEDRVRQFRSRRRRHNVVATTDATCNSRRWRRRRHASATRPQMATPGQNNPPLQTVIRTSYPGSWYLYINEVFFLKTAYTHKSPTAIKTMQTSNKLTYKVHVEIDECRKSLKRND